MKPLVCPAILFYLTLSRNNLVDIAAQWFDNPLVARRALFYIAGSVLLCWLYAMVWLNTPWRPAGRRIAIALVCCWGILEEGQCAVCRIATGIDQPAKAEMWRGICDQLSSIPASTITLAIPVVIAYWLANKRWE